MNNYYVYFKNDEGLHRVLYNDDRYETLIPKETSDYRYEMFKGYEASNEGLMKFKTDLIRWNEELKNNSIFKIDWFSKSNHLQAVEQTFKCLCKKH